MEGRYAFEGAEVRALLAESRAADERLMTEAQRYVAAGIVLGPPVARSAVLDLLGVEGRTVINGREAGRGTGADVLGHPHNALAWLANHLASHGSALRAGEIVMTGSLVKTVWLGAGDEATMEFSGLGSVQVTFV